jgi:hypothetical protein
MQEKPNISRKAFWDVKFEDLDFEKYKDYIIAKVFEYGTWQDMLAITRFYGKDQIRNSLVNSYYLSTLTLYFASVILNTPKEHFKCYERRQLQKNAWPF